MLTSYFPLLFLCGLLLFSFGFFRHYSSLKFDFVDFLFKFVSVTKSACATLKSRFPADFHQIDCLEFAQILLKKVG